MEPEQRFQPKPKSAYLIIQTIEDKTLETSSINPDKREFQPEFTAINEFNHKSLWIIDEREPGLFELVNGFTDKVLTALDNGKLLISKGKGDHSQYWKLTETNTGNVRISNSKFRDLFISYDSIRKCPTLKKNSNDLWEFRRVTNNKDLNKTCFIFDPRDQLMIDVPESSLREEETIYVWKANYRFNQRWRLYKAGEVYIIKSYISKLNLDVFEENFENNEKIIQYHSTGGMNQMWMLEKMENSVDEYRIYCFAEPEYELGHNGKKLKLHKGKHFVWKIEGYIPQ